MNEQDPQISAIGSESALTWLASWLVMLLVLTALAQTPWGKRIVYYVAWLSVLFLVVTHFGEFSSLFGNFASEPGSTLTAPPPGTLPPTGGIPGGKE